MAERIEISPDHFSSRFPVVVYIRPAEDLPEAWREEAWRELDRGPGYFSIPAGQVASVRIHGIDDDVLRVISAEIAPCSRVVELGLAENRRVTDAGVASLAGLAQLISLNLSSCSLTNAGMETLAGFRQLVRLNLSYCNRITDPGLRQLKSLNRLCFLDLQGCVKLTNGGVAHLRHRGLQIHRP